jgi:GntR family transcriptional regulator
MVAVEQQTADAELAYRLGIEEGAGVILRSRHMLADGHLIQLYDGYYPLELFAGTEIATATLIPDGIYAAFERLGYRPERATEEISARAPTPEEATLLRLGAGVPVLTVTRTTRDRSDRVLEALEVVASGEANVFIYEDLPLD